MMSIDADEDEHSIEMQLPYIAKVMQPARGNFTIVPVMVGSLSPNSEAKYGKIFARYLQVNPLVPTVILNVKFELSGPDGVFCHLLRLLPLGGQVPLHPL